MKKVTKMLIPFLFIAFAGNAQAQAKINGIGGGIAMVMPTGDFSKLADSGMGIIFTTTHDQDWVENVELTGSVGYVKFGEKSLGEDLQNLGVGFQFSLIPVMGGARYYLNGKEAPSKVWIGGNMGFHFVSLKFGDTTTFGYYSESENEVAMALAGGAVLGGIGVEARISFLGDFNYFLASASYSFPWGE